MAWQRNGTPDTLGSPSDLIEITDLSGLKFNVTMTHLIATGTVFSQVRVNADASSAYSFRRSFNGTTDTISINQIFLEIFSGTIPNSSFEISYLVGISGEEKLAMGWLVDQGGVGSGNVPNREEWVGKYVPASLTDTINQYSNVNVFSGDFDTNSNLSTVGTD